MAQAEKRADRFTTQGLIGLKSTPNCVSMVQFACETDFVAKTDKFREGTQAILDTIHNQEDLVINSDQIDDNINKLSLPKSLDPDLPSQTIEDGVKHVISKTQENCNLLRVFRSNVSADKGEVCGTYLHSKYTPEIGKIGSLFILSTSNSVVHP